MAQPLVESVTSSLPAVGGGAVWALGALFAVLIIGFVVMIIHNMAQYRITVNVVAKTANGTLFMKDKARYIKNRDTKRPESIRLRKLKMIEQNPGASFLMHDEKGKPVYNGVLLEDKLVWTKASRYIPRDDDLKIEWKQSDLHAVLRAHEDVKEMFSVASFFEKYGTILATGGLAVVVLLMGIMLFQQMGGVAEQLGNVASSLSQVAGENTGPAVIPAG